MRRRVAVIGKRLRQRVALVRRWHHRRQGHLVYGTVIPHFVLAESEWQRFWRRGFRCEQCKLDWPTYK